MNILQVNKFFYPKGGAEKIFFDTAKLLEEKGHRVFYFSMHHPDNLASPYARYFVKRAEYENPNPAQKLSSLLNLFYSWQAKKKIELLIGQEHPQVAHLNNIYHQISPSILHSLKKLNIPVVMTLHDYKLVCASYSMLYQDSPCQDCQNKRYYYCFLNGCMKDSRLKSLVSTLEMYLHHQVLGLYRLVDCFIAPSLFLKNKIEEMGFKGKIIYLPNFVKKEEFQPQYGGQEKSVVYFGRLSSQKGLLTLLKAAAQLKDIQFKIIGDGPQKTLLQEKITEWGLENTTLLGILEKEKLELEISKAMFAIVPSECYENSSRAVIEAFALGKPVVGARIGGIPELVCEGKTGLLFTATEAIDLTEKISGLAAQPELIKTMGKNARLFVEEKLNAERYYAKLIKIYEDAINNYKYN